MSAARRSGNDMITYTVMGEEIGVYLDAVARVVETGDDDALASIARIEVPGMLGAVRDALAGHAPDERGRCPLCRGRRLPWWRGQTVPCRFYRAIRDRLIPPETGRRHTLPDGVGTPVRPAGGTG
ncbi:hypothetical protein [Saccharothrix lopnurensis]|uniref:Uncharacterized protein n=1 Tax=Saccharothrix lopnurensis TaxID=1670621 RepID=A0ABW1PGJ8_9PSEU